MCNLGELLHASLMFYANFMAFQMIFQYIVHHSPPTTVNWTIVGNLVHKNSNIFREILPFHPNHHNSCSKTKSNIILSVKITILEIM